ncbi:unnamed protein product [Effrenium voratum]|nr:unnamed protein product [Effrenium voratum]
MSDSLPQGLQVVSPRILSKISRNHEYEVGELVITIEGEHFGTKDNGNMIVALETFGGQTQSVLDLRQAEGLGDPTIVISCETISHEDDTRILSRCIQGGTSIFGDPVSESFYAERVEEPLDPGADATTRRLQQVSIDTLALQLSRLPVAISVNYELDCSILNRLNETCGLRPENISVPSSRQWQAVRLKPCPAGEHRINYTGTECLQCAPGKFKSGVGPALQCDVCPVAFYMGLFGAGACMACPDFETTQSTGALDIAACDCSPGYYRLSNGSEAWQEECEGGAVMPYSASGYWTPDRIKFWHCFPDSACLQGSVQEPNLCAAGRTVDAIRCGQCAAHAWADAGQCYECHWWDDVISYVGPFLWPILMLGAFLTLVIRSLHTSDMSRTKKEKRLLRHKHSSWIGRLGELDHGEFRMLIICVTSLQTLWLVSLMPLPFTRFSELWLWGLGFSAWDFSIFRPQCGFKTMSYLTKWLTQWSVFFIMMFLLVLSIWLYCHFHKNSRRDLNWIHPKQGILGMISLSLMILLLVHLRDDLIFTQCIHCEDDRFCLAAQPVIYCELSDWATMAVLSSLDIAFVIIGSIPLIGACIYKSWRWQHGEESALGSDFEAPWYVFFSELLGEATPGLHQGSAAGGSGVRARVQEQAFGG